MKLNVQTMHLKVQKIQVKFQICIWNFRQWIWYWNHATDFSDHALEISSGLTEVQIYLRLHSDNRGFHYGAKFFTKFFTNLNVNFWDFEYKVCLTTVKPPDCKPNLCINFCLSVLQSDVWQIPQQVTQFPSWAVWGCDSNILPPYAQSIGSWGLQEVTNHLWSLHSTTAVLNSWNDTSHMIAWSESLCSQTLGLGKTWMKQAPSFSLHCFKLSNKFAHKFVKNFVKNFAP